MNNYIYSLIIICKKNSCCIVNGVETGPYSHPFFFEWSDAVNDVALCMYSIWGGAVNIPSQYWTMQFHSPDLSSSDLPGSELWQHKGLCGYSVEILDRISVHRPLYCNLYVVVYDIDQGRYRNFFNGTSQVLPHGTWTKLTFDWSQWSSLKQAAGLDRR